MQPWPASQYLARMAEVPELQERVARIALAVPSTQNVRVHEDLADVALALPVQLALRFVGPAKGWCQDPSFSRIADKIGALIEKFLGDGEVDAALQLSEALFDPENRTTANLESGHEAWEYEQSIRNFVPPLVAAGGLRALEILTTCLLKLVRTRSGSERLEAEYSYIWRPAIESHDQNLHRSDARQALIDAVRDGAQSISTPTELPAIVQHLEAAESPLLNRIALHLLRVAPEVPTDLIASHLLDRERLHNINSWHEYTLLARERLPEAFESDEQSQIVRWAVELAIERAMDARPGEDEESEDPEVTERRVRAYERLRALERFREVVPAEFQARHEELEREFGKAEHPEFLTYHGGVWRGEASPKAARRAADALGRRAHRLPEIVDTSDRPASPDGSVSRRSGTGAEQPRGD